MKRLYEQQQKLQAATSRIEKKLDEIKQSGHPEQEAGGVRKFYIPRHLSVSINTPLHTTHFNLFYRQSYMMHTGKVQMMMKMKLNGISLSSNDVDFMYELLVCIFTGLMTKQIMI